MNKIQYLRKLIREELSDSDIEEEEVIDLEIELEELAEICTQLDEIALEVGKNFSGQKEQILEIVKQLQKIKKDLERQTA